MFPFFPLSPHSKRASKSYQLEKWTLNLSSWNDLCMHCTKHVNSTLFCLRFSVVYGIRCGCRGRNEASSWIKCRFNHFTSFNHNISSVLQNIITSGITHFSKIENARYRQEADGDFFFSFVLLSCCIPLIFEVFSQWSKGKYDKKKIVKMKLKCTNYMGYCRTNKADKAIRFCKYICLLQCATCMIKHAALSLLCPL